MLSGGGLRAATSFLAARPEVDAERIGAIGICLGGGYALKHAAFDPRVKALAVVAAAFNDPRAMRDGFGAEGYRQAMASFAAVEAAELADAPVQYLKAVSDVEGEEAAMGAPSHSPTTAPSARPARGGATRSPGSRSSHC